MLLLSHDYSRFLIMAYIVTLPSFYGDMFRWVRTKKKVWRWGQWAWRWCFSFFSLCVSYLFATSCMVCSKIMNDRNVFYPLLLPSGNLRYDLRRRKGASCHPSGKEIPRFTFPLCSPHLVVYSRKSRCCCTAQTGLQSQPLAMEDRYHLV